jgi:hypothetical protein
VRGVETLPDRRSELGGNGMCHSSILRLNGATLQALR